MTAFTKLRDVREADIDTVLTGLTEPEWDDLETGYLDVMSIEVCDLLDSLGIAADRTDSVSVFWRIYQHMLNRTPEV
jgi:hypothetical protein